MSVIAVASAKGSPGATMTGLALATQWAAPVTFADVDPAGGDLVWRVRDGAGAPLDPDRGLLTLAAAARRGASETRLGDHVQQTSLGVPVLLGVPSPEQLSGLGGIWTQLTDILSAHDHDVVVDCGRVSAGSPALSVLLKADVVLFVARPDLEGTAHLRQLLHTLAGSLRLSDHGGPPVGVALTTSYRETGVVGDLQRLLDSEGLSARVLGIAADDPKGAAMLCAARSGNLSKSLLSRSARTLAAHLTQALSSTAARS